MKTPTSNTDMVNNNQILKIEQQDPVLSQQQKQTRNISTSEISNNGDIELDNSNNYADDIESLEELLNFDPFKVNVNRQMLVNEFVTDGSLGLVHF